MEIQDIRRAVLRTLISTKHPSVRQFALGIKKPDGQINDMLATPPRKSFGERIARAIEKAYPLPPGFLDDINHASDEYRTESSSRKLIASQSNVIYAPFNATITEVIDIMQSVDEDVQRDILGAARVAASRFWHKNTNPAKRSEK